MIIDQSIFCWSVCAKCPVLDLYKDINPLQRSKVRKRQFYYFQINRSLIAMNAILGGCQVTLLPWAIII